MSRAAARRISIDNQIVTLPHLPMAGSAGEMIGLTLRPEAVKLGVIKGHDIVLDGTVSAVSFLGSVIRLKIKLGDNAISLNTFNDQRRPPPAHNEPVKISISSFDVLPLEA